MLIMLIFHGDEHFHHHLQSLVLSGCHKLDVLPSQFETHLYTEGEMGEDAGKVLQAQVSSLNHHLMLDWHS